MNLAARLAVAMLCWAGAAAAGWWWQRPGDVPQATGAAVATVDTAAVENAAPSPQTMASRVAAADPMGLNRAPTAVPGAAATAPAGLDSITWRLAALVVRGAERYAVMTAGGQTPLRLRTGEALPDGDRIKAIHANRIDIQSPRGRLRTLYLIEP